MGDSNAADLVVPEDVGPNEVHCGSTLRLRAGPKRWGGSVGAIGGSGERGLRQAPKLAW